ncbi:MAG: hypothetical protein DMF34_07215 [Verrucomicrobia bacterium]|nr:MAG: hypothetical protein DMF34_07215 [Verrucomicrobiota bacterium]
MRKCCSAEAVFRNLFHPGYRLRGNLVLPRSRVIFSISKPRLRRCMHRMRLTTEEYSHLKLQRASFSAPS